MRHLSIVVALAACHATSPNTGDDTAGPDAGSDVGSNGSDDYVHDTGLEGPAFTLTDPSCQTTSTSIECGAADHPLVYSVVDGTELHLDLYAPLSAQTQKVPVIMFVHGGGWLSGDYHKIGLQIEDYLAAGYAVVGVEYRLTADPFPTPSGWQFPDNLKDVKTAIRWMRIKAGGFIDGDRILAYGFSAGAHLVSMVDTTGGVAEFEGRGNPSVPSTVRATVGLSTPLAFHLFFPMNPSLDAACPSQAPPGPGGTPADGVSMLLGVAPADFESLAGSPKLAWVSAMTYLDAQDPPMLLFAGTCDQIVPYTGVNEMSQLAQSIGAAVDVFITPMAFHGGTLGTQAAQDKLAAFITAELGE